MMKWLGSSCSLQQKHRNLQLQLPNRRSFLVHENLVESVCPWGEDEAQSGQQDPQNTTEWLHLNGRGEGVQDHRAHLNHKNAPVFKTIFR